MEGVLVLTAELVPSTSWYNNLRAVMSKDQWDHIRREVYAYYGHRCGICNALGSLHCHEVWSYDDATLTQTLDGFVALCPWCHHIKHLGYAGILANEGKLDYERLIRHFMQVNRCERADFYQHREAAFDQWERRSQHRWKIDIGEYAEVCESDPKQLSASQ
jgi:hypothetical protein